MPSRWVLLAHIEATLIDEFLSGVFQDAKCTCRRSANLGRFVRIDPHPFLALAYKVFHISSQSVSKLNTSWSNNPKMGARKAGRGGFAGREDLEQTRRYRDADEDRDRGYGMVFDVPDGGRHRSASKRKHSRSGSREKYSDRDRDKDRDGRRKRSRSPPRREKDRRRSRSSERDRHRYR